MKILVTGFEKFHTFDQNPTEIAVNMLEGSNLIKEILPVDIQQIPKIVPELLLKHKPDIAIFCGMAYSRPFISLEKVAVNIIKDSIRKDNAGRDLSIPDSIVKDGETLYNSLPLSELNAYLKSKNIKTEVSFDAGTYVCNQTLYIAFNCIKENKLNTKCTFVHFPPTNQLLKSSNYSQEYINKALEEIVRFFD